MLEPDTLIHNRYRIVRLIAEGGMGAVYEAIDTRLNHLVALKQTRVQGEQASKAFQREAQLLARLKHPALPNVSDFFTDDAGQFLVMEYVPGDDLGTLIKKQGQPISVDMALDWTNQILQVLRFLHTQDPPVIHRDIKPENLKRASDDHIVLLDFGLAKGSEALRTRLADTRSVMGYTLQYAPPEQVQGSGTDARSDLYSLAATMYYLLAGHSATSATERAAALTQKQPDPLRPLHIVNPAIPESFSTVIHRAMALNAAKRFASAQEMQQALHKVSTSSTARTSDTPPWMMPLLAGVVGVVVIVLISIVVLLFNTPPPPPPPSAPGTPTTAQTSFSPETTAHQTTSPSSEPPLDQTVPSLDLPVHIGTPIPMPVDAISPSNVDRVELLAQWQETGNVLSIVFSPDKETVALASDTIINLRRVSDGELLHTLEGHEETVLSLAFSPDGQTLASASDDQTVRLWNVSTGENLHTITGTASLWSVAFSPNGKMLATGDGNNLVQLWQVSDGTLVHSLAGHTGWVLSVAFSPDGQYIASGSADKNIGVWNVANQSLERTLEGHADRVSSVTFSPDGKTIASASVDKTIRLWNVADGQTRLTLAEHSDTIYNIAFAPNGQSLASVSKDQTVRLWDVTTGEPLRTLRGEEQGFNRLAFASGGQLLASVSPDAKIWLWGVPEEY